MAVRFDELFSNDDVLDALWDMHFDECTPIQEHAIPHILEGKDLIAVAQTGTGKTAAYLLPILNKIAEGDFPADAVNCIVMAPTRELAQQIDRQLQGFAYFLPVSSVPIYGGTDGHTYEQQKKGLKLGADIVIATPGRLLAHISMGYVDLSRVSFLILDEADRMLDMGFYDDIMQIVNRLPKERQTLLFSATMPQKIQMLAKNILTNPAEVKLAVSKPADKIDQSAYICYEPQKLPILKEIFKQEPPERVIVFSSSKLKVKELTRALRKELKEGVGEMHSDLDQNVREDVILDFKAGKIKVLVATDIVARGIDIDDIEMVINYDVPREAEDYVHRIGRTARANRDGKAVTFVSERDKQAFRRIEKLLEKPVPKKDLPEGLGEQPTYSSEEKPRSKGRFNRGRSNRGRSNKEGNTQNRANRDGANQTHPEKGGAEKGSAGANNRSRNHGNRHRRGGKGQNKPEALVKEPKS